MDGNSKHDDEIKDRKHTMEVGLGRYFGKRDKVAIVGAGMSGLVAAWLLLRAGFDVTLIEASKRVGGRIKTLREGFSSGLYAEAGAMRIPESHQLTRFLCEDVFGLELAEFPETEDNAMYYLNGVHIRSGDYHSTKQFGDPYQGSKRSAALLDDALGLIRLTGTLHDTLYCISPDTNVKDDRSNLDQFSLGDYLRELTRGNNIFTKETVGAPFNSSDIDLMGFEISSFELQASLLETLRHRDTMAGKKLQIIGGMDLLPNAFLRLRAGASLQPMDDRIVFSARVTDVTHENDRFTLSYDTPFYHAARISADFVILAAPFAALSHVRFGTHVLDSDKLRAIRTLHYENATKIILEFSQRFWDEEGDLTPIKGGRSVTDLPIRWVLYPPRRQLIPGSRRGVLLASYTLGEDSSRWTSLSSQDRIWFALKNLVELHFNKPVSANTRTFQQRLSTTRNVWSAG